MLPIASAPIKKKRENKFTQYSAFLEVADYFDVA